MLKKVAIATGIFTVSAITAAGMTFAQTTEPTEAPTPTVAETTTTTPDAAPATGNRAW